MVSEFKCLVVHDAAFRTRDFVPELFRIRRLLAFPKDFFDGFHQHHVILKLVVEVAGPASLPPPKPYLAIPVSLPTDKRELNSQSNGTCVMVMES